MELVYKSASDLSLCTSPLLHAQKPRQVASIDTCGGYASLRRGQPPVRLHSSLLLFSLLTFHLSLKAGILRVKGEERDKKNLRESYGCLSSLLHSRAFVPDSILGISNLPDCERTRL
jgi:hypothetical protein